MEEKIPFVQFVLAQPCLQRDPDIRTKGGGNVGFNSPIYTEGKGEGNGHGGLKKGFGHGRSDGHGDGFGDAFVGDGSHDPSSLRPPVK
jgi:hypothetical protein